MFICDLVNVQHEISQAKELCQLTIENYYQLAPRSSYQVVSVSSHRRSSNHTVYLLLISSNALICSLEEMDSSGSAQIRLVYVLQTSGPLNWEIVPR